MIKFDTPLLMALHGSGSNHITAKLKTAIVRAPLGVTARTEKNFSEIHIRMGCILHDVHLTQNEFIIFKVKPTDKEYRWHHTSRDIAEATPNNLRKAARLRAIDKATMTLIDRRNRMLDNLKAIES